MENWHGIMKVVEIKHLDQYGKLLWQQKNVKNMLHAEGEEFILRAVFTGGYVNNTIIPEYYYLGMDNRTTPISADVMVSLLNEPTSTYGYQRQTLSPDGVFEMSQSDSGHWIASSPIMAFRAQNGSWGPVRNVFLTDKDDNTGSLIASAQFDSPIIVNDGESITMRIALMLQDCPTQ